MPDILDTLVLRDQAGANRTASKHRQLRENSGLTRGQMRAAKKKAALQEAWLKRDVDRVPHVGYVPPVEHRIVPTPEIRGSAYGLRETSSTVTAVYQESRGPKRPRDGRVSKGFEAMPPESCVECGTNPLRRFQRCQATTHNAVETRPLIQTHDMAPSREVIRDQNAYPLKPAKPSRAFNADNPRTFDECPCDHEHVGYDCLIPRFVY